MRRIDIRYLRRRGWLYAGRHGSLSWSSGDQSLGSISYRIHSASLELVYRTRADDDEWRDVNEHVSFSFTEQRLGGTRRWFLCPRCGKRCAVLYGGSYFRCRGCHGLAYGSQHEPSAMWRATAKAQKLRERLGGSGDMDDAFPGKPKGMHWKTYELARRKAEQVEERLGDLEGDYYAQLIGRLGIGLQPK